ncbi:MAG: apolipoprotein N-acyltransferase [Acidimicrobiales bacterium]
MTATSPDVAMTPAALARTAGAGWRTATLLAVCAGLVAALSLPSWGWWPLGIAGVAGLPALLGDRSARGRALVGAGFGTGFFVPGLWWMGEFNAAGAALVVVLETVFVAAAAALVPPGRARVLALPGALVLAEAVRGAVPFGGLPMAGLALGQAGSPMAGAARVGGPLLVLALVAVAAVGVAEAVSRRWATAGLALGLALAGTLAGAAAPDGGGGRSLTTAVVQGGGRRGFTGAEGDDPADVLARHVAASEDVRGPVDLVVWPEDVIDVDGPIGDQPEGALLAEVARRAGATLVAGVVEGAGPERFRNAALAWGPDGTVVDRFEKVHRVPFGEYVPGRAFFDRFADLSPIPRDAIAGQGPGILRTPAGDLGVMVSYEVFFADRARGAARAGGRLLLVPTNAASFSTSQVPSQQLASARLRAIETGRDLVQAAPTGYSAVIDNRGRVLVRSTLGRRQVLHHTVTLRSGRTLYVQAGDAPVLALAAAAVAAAWVGARRRQPGSGR